MPSLLDPLTPVVPVLTDADKARILAHDTTVAVQQLLAFPSQEFQRRLAAVAAQFSLVWDDPAKTPDILTGLGVNAKAMFALAAADIAYLEGAMPGSTTTITSKVKPTKDNGDGTLSLE